MQTLTLKTQAVWQTTIDPGTIDDLAQRFSLWSQDVPNHLVSGRGGWQTPTLRLGQLPWADRLWELLTPKLEQVYSNLGWPHSRPRVSNYWFNINPPGAFNFAHDHPRARVASVVWLRAEPAAGDLVFELASTAWPADSDTDYNRAERRFAPAAGQVLFWPSEVRHRVEPNLSAQPRISVSANWI